MILKKSFSNIYLELKTHAPFTLIGAVLGIGFMVIFKNANPQIKSSFFLIAHPAHVVLSAIVTASMLRCHSRFKKNFILILVMSWIGAIGVATVSDIVIPHVFGTQMFRLNIPVHSTMHEHDRVEDEHDHHDHAGHDHHDHAEHDKKHTGIHLAFIEEWLIINSAALVGILIGFFRPATKFPHSGHVLLSTWASGSYILMTTTHSIGMLVWLGILVVLFVSVWLPCCISDIVFPLLFVDSENEHPHCCHGHKANNEENPV